jgi:hypothetical protein
MKTKTAWLFPEIDLPEYLKKYPFVFFFSLLSAFSLALGTLTHLFLGQNIAMPLPGAMTAVRCLQLGIPLFALLHLLLALPRPKWLKTPAVVHALGFVLLYLCFNYFLKRESLDTSDTYEHLYLLLVGAGLCLPLLGMKDSPSRQWVYLTKLLFGLSGAILLTLAVSFFLSKVIPHIPWTYFSLFMADDSYGSELGNSMVRSIVFPWYLIGAVHQTLSRRGEGKEEGLAIGPTVLFAAMFLVLAGYFFDGMLAITDMASLTSGSDEFLYGIVTTFVLTYGSFLILIPLRSKKDEPWITQYQKIFSAVSIPILFFAGWVLFKGAAFGETASYYFLYGLVWFLFVFTYSFFKPKAGLAWPAFLLLALMTLSWGGPLSVRELSFRHHRAGLEKVLTQNGMIQNGKVVKPQNPLDVKKYGELEGHLLAVANNFGLERLQDLFTQDLSALSTGEVADEYRNNGSQNVERLLQMVGVQQCDTVAPTDQPKSFSTKRGEGALNVAGYDQLQRFYLTNSCPVLTPENRDRYLVSLSGQNELLMVQYNGNYVVDIPLQKIEQALKAHDYSQVFQMSIPPDEMMVEFENKKIKAKVYFEHVEAFKSGNFYKISGGQGNLLIKQK